MITRTIKFAHSTVSLVKETYDTLEMKQLIVAALIALVTVIVVAISFNRRKKKHMQDIWKTMSTEYANSRTKHQDSVEKQKECLQRISDQMSLAQEEWVAKRNRRKILYVIVFIFTTVIVYKSAVTWNKLTMEQKNYKTVKSSRSGGGGGSTSSMNKSSETPSTELVKDDDLCRSSFFSHAQDVKDNNHDDEIKTESGSDASSQQGGGRHDSDDDRNMRVGNILQYIKRGPCTF